MYCNSCMMQISKNEVVYCEQCGVPLHKKCANNCMICKKTLCDTCYAENNFKCEDCFKPNKSFQIIRRSYIEQYAECPYSLYLQLVKGIEPPMGKHAQLGVIVHKLIERISKNEIDIAQAKAMLEDEIQEWNSSTDEEYSLISLDLESVGNRCLDAFWLMRDRFAEDCKTEYQMKYSIEDDLPMISCTADRIDFDKDEIYIHDWKTGKAMSGQKLITNLQPPLYIEAVAKTFGTYPKAFTLHYLNAGKSLTYKNIAPKRYEVTTSRNSYILDIDESLERTKKILTDIKKGKFNMPKKETHQWRCKNMCWFGLSGKCEGSQKEQWRILNEQYAS